MLAKFILTTIYVTLASGSPTFGRLRSETTHLDQLVQDSNNNDNKVQMEVLQTTRNLSQPEVQLLNQLTARFRQEEGEVGLEVGQNVGEIISGVLGGGLGNVFQGSSSFIGNANVQEEVDFVLGNVSPVFDTILKYGFNGIKQYLGIGTSTTTTTPSVDAESATEQATIIIPIYINPNQSTQLTPAQQEQLYQQQLAFEIQNLQQKLQEITKDADVTTFSSVDPDRDLDLDIVEGGRDELLAHYPLLVRSRVERVNKI